MARYRFLPAILAPYLVIHGFMKQQVSRFLLPRVSRTCLPKMMMTSSIQQQQQPLPPAISIQDISCTHDGGETWQLRHASYVLPRAARVGLVGRNGSGKSTLLSIMAEKTCVDRTMMSTADRGMKYTGEITSPRDVRVAYVEQEPPSSSELLVADALLGMRVVDSDDDNQTTETNSDNHQRSVYAAVRRYRRASERAESDPSAFTRASAEMDALSGWDVLTKAEEIATKLRVRHLQDRPLSNLSGGERKRVALAAALVQEPDVLLLDEPTNFLSLAGVQWLADVLLGNDGGRSKGLTILMVTHDRAFLDEICTSILELDRGQLYEYRGKYGDYLRGKEQRLALEDAAVRAAKAKYRVELEWMRRQPQARESKSKARIDAFHKLERSSKPRPRDPSLTLAAATGGQRRMGGKILTMRDVSLYFGERVMLKDFSYDFFKGDRICLAGANGVGKTTFVKLLSGELSPDRGEIEVGDTIVLGVYDQLGIELGDDPEQKVLEFVLDRVQSREGTAMSEAPNEARRLLRQFEFPRKRWNERVAVLSGGERRRLQILSVLSQRPNFLVMDEPSVDCDLDTLQALEAFLREFDGVLIIVSHDRAFADKVTDHLFVFEGNGDIRDFEGSLSEYANALVQLENDAIPGYPSSLGGEGGQEFSSPTATTNEKRRVYKEDRAKRNEQRNALRRAKREMENLETAIEKLRRKAHVVQREIDSSSNEGWSVLAELTEKLSKLNDDIDEKEIQWMELAELVETEEIGA